MIVRSPHRAVSGVTYSQRERRYIFDVEKVPRMRRPLCLACLLVMLGGCANNLPPESVLSVVIKPGSATVTAFGTVDLSATASGFTDTTFVFWFIEEGPYLDGSSCGYLNPTKTPLLTDCIHGYVTYTSDKGTSLTATYYAPATPGTYHVVLQVMQSSGFNVVGKTATAEFIVTP